jgi:ABC-type glycerol-3-phosphate transport system substrate-binding protein
MRRALVGLAALSLLAGCSGGTATPPAATSTSTVDPVAVCTNQLVYWAKDILGNAKDTGLDYQEMGLDGDQYEALQALIDEARKHQSGGTVPPDWLQEQAKAACVKLAAKPTPTSRGNGWP